MRVSKPQKVQNGDVSFMFFLDTHEDNDQYAGPVLCTDLQVVRWG